MASNYNISYVAFNGTVAKADLSGPLTITATGPSKIYGTTLTAGPSARNFTAGAGVNGETVTSVTLTPDVNGLSATTPAKSAYVVTPSAAIGIGGFLASNYNISYVPLNGTVIPAQLTVIGLTIAPKTYDGTTVATLEGTPIFSGLVNGDTATLIGIAIGIFNSPNVITASTVTISGLSTNVSSNYVFTLPTIAATISPKALTMSGLSVPINKAYDGTTNAVVSGTATLATAEAPGAGTSIDGRKYTGDVVSITGTPFGTYNTKDVATASTVSYSGLSLAGSSASNYSLIIQSPSPSSIVSASGNISIQIIPITTNNLLQVVNNINKITYETLNPYKLSVNTYEPLVYFYHPLTPINQSTSTTDFTLDTGAYDFIDNSLKLKKLSLPAATKLVSVGPAADVVTPYYFIK